MVQLQALSRIVIIVYRLRQVLGHTQSTVYNSSRVSSRLIQNPECPIQSHLRCPIHIQSIGNSSRSRVRRHRGPLNLWSQLTQLNRVSQLTQLTRLTQLTQLTSTGSTGSGDLVWPPGQVNHCDQYHCYYYVSTGSIGVNWVHWVRRFSVGAWSIRPRLLLLRVNWVKWVHWGQLG